MRIVDIKNLNLSILPTKYHEQYRNFDISKVFEQELNFKIEPIFNKAPYEHLENSDFYNIYYFNNTIFLNGLEDYFEISFEKFKKNKNSLYYLNSYIKNVITKLTIKKKLDKPLNIINIFEGINSFFYQNLHLIFKEKTQLIETFYNKNLKDSFLSINRKYEIKKDVKVSILKVQSIKNSSIISNYLTKIGKNSSLKMVILDYESSLALNIFDSKLNKQNSSLDIQGLVKIANSQKVGNIAFIEHIKNNTNSNIDIKHLLDNKTHALFDVTSTVQNSASYSKAFQNSQTILLNDKARINANPRLEIYIDELQASHGASTGTLNEDELYYLYSRGISKAKAKKMIIDSIELQVIQTINNKKIKKYIKRIKDE